MNQQLELSNFLSPILEVFKIANEEYENLFEEGLKEYLTDQTKKHFFVNTFLHRHEKVKFYDIYFPAKAKYDETEYDFSNLKSILDKHQYLTLVGTAGSGKSTLVNYLFLEVIKKKFRIPIKVELRKLNNSNSSIIEFIRSQILDLRIKPGKRTLQRALKTGSFIFLLDGYDEIYNDKKQSLLNNLEKFIDTYPNNNYVITTRPGSGIERFTRFHDFKLSALDFSDVKNFVSLMIDNEERQERILESINKPENQNYRNYLSNPLLLSMFLLTFETHPEIPKRTSSFYSNVFETLYSKHDGITKNSFPREKLTKLQKEEFETILNAFSFRTFSRGSYKFLEDEFRKALITSSQAYDIDINDLIYDLTTTISIMVVDGLEYQFPHRSMQEYFVAKFIDSLPESKKELAFTKINESFRSSYDTGWHFWNLCKELNENAYLRYCLLPALKSFEASFDHSSNDKVLASFLKQYRPSFTERPFEEGVDEAVYFWVPRESNIFNSLIDFNDIYASSEIYDYFCYEPNQLLFEDVYKKFGDKDNKPLDEELYLNNEAFKKLLHRTGFTAELRRKIKSIKDAIRTIEEKLTLDSDELDLLLS